MKSIFSNIVKNIFLLLIVLFIFLFFFRPIETEDIWWHLSSGKWISENKSIPTYDIFSYTKEPVSGISSQWLGSCIFYSVYTLYAENGLKLFRSLLFLTIIILFFFYSRKKVPSSILFLLILLMVFGLGTRCFLRPFIFNFLFILIFLMILFRYKRDNNPKWLIVLPLCCILWVNIHLGSAVYGFTLIGIFLFSSFVKYVESIIFQEFSHDRPRLLRNLKHLLYTLMFYALTLLINPYGINGALYCFKIFLIPEYIEFYKMKKVLMELQPPSYIFTFSGFWFWILLWISLYALIKRNNKGKRPVNTLTYYLLLIVSTFMFLKGIRGSGFFVLSCSMIAVEKMGELELKKSWEAKKILFAINRWGLCIVFIIAMIISVRIINEKVVVNNQTRRARLLEHVAYNPVEVVDILKDNGIFGNVFVDIMNGGYVIWAGYPKIKPFVDGRQFEFNRNLYWRYLEVVKNPQRYWPVAEKKYNYNIAIVDLSLRSGDKLLEYLGDNPSWQLIAVKGIYALFVKRNYYYLPKELDEFEDRMKSAVVSQSMVDLLISKPSSAVNFYGRIKRFLNPLPFYVDIIEESIILFRLGYKNAAVNSLARALPFNEVKAKSIVSFNQ